ncbi:hypothetical protein [Methanoplanus endosymbiosus]|uniref:Uncharacterized protein n=1 Tax=Methanoplanus endosymbiosus TaxID=33865 RepID=A0A9E7PLE0_9EURY|nr:hypothetical protein [Methanoplanus endosymbiosus]UUX92268.1 hypothetical protein L6E24_13100 [Methanoplanus endosymbiosus]
MSTHNNVKKINPKDLLVPERLDIIVKYLYIQALESRQDNDFFNKLYINHILKRTGGKQYIYQYIDGKPYQSHSKEGIDRYLDDFLLMIESFKKSGFQKEYFIPVSSQNGIILDGAHRASCCIYFNIEPIVLYEPRLGRKWDYKWFLENDFEQEEINIIVETFCKIKKENVFACILWAPLKEYWDDIQEIITKSYKIIYVKDFKINNSNFDELVYDIYSQEFGVDIPKKITNKINLLKEYNTDLRLIFFYIDEPEYIQMNQRDMCLQVIKQKEKIRDNWNSIIEKEKFITLHTSDNSEHTQHITSIFLSQNNLAHLNLRKATHYRKELFNWLCEYENVLKHYGISKNDCCIVGSGPLEIVGIREATDIDFILHSTIREKLFDEKSRSLSENVDIVHKGYHEYNNPSLPISDDEIITNNKNHFLFRGLKFANIKIIRERKNNHQRDKDVEDVYMIDEFFRKNKIDRGV